VPSAAFCQYRPGRERNSSKAVCGTPATYVAGSVKSGISIELSVSIVTDGHLHVGRHGACRLQASPMAEWATIPAPCAPPPVTVYSILCAGGGQVAHGPLSCRRRRGGIGFPPITATYYCDMQQLRRSCCIHRQPGARTPVSGIAAGYLMAAATSPDIAASWGPQLVQSWHQAICQVS